MSGIFINYRGDDSETAAALIDRELAARFGKDQVFLDSRSILAGSDFVEELLERLQTCSLLLVVIGPRWLTLTDAAGRRRIDDPQDWVHREIVEAFAHGLRVIPVLMDGVRRPAEDELPDDIAGLGRRQDVPLRRRHTSRDLDYLVECIAQTDPELAKIAAQRQSSSDQSPQQLPVAAAHSAGRPEPTQADHKSLPAHMSKHFRIVAGISSIIVFAALLTLIIVVGVDESDTEDGSAPPGTSQAGADTLPGNARPSWTTRTGGTSDSTTLIHIPQGTEIPLSLVADAADYQVPPRWRLRGEAIESGRCSFQLFGPAGYGRYVDGADPLVHGRQAGTYQVRSAANCRIYVQGGDEDFITLPYVLDGTGQSSASPVFEADSGFTVSMGPGQKCGATVFRDHDGGKEDQSVGADSTKSFRGPGRFWVETETYDCRLEISGG